MILYDVYNVKRDDIIMKTMVAAKRPICAGIQYNEADIMLFVTSS
jgi:hypothetical protein